MQFLVTNIEVRKMQISLQWDYIFGKWPEKETWNIVFNNMRALQALMRLLRSAYSKVTMNTLMSNIVESDSRKWESVRVAMEL